MDNSLSFWKRKTIESHLQECEECRNIHLDFRRNSVAIAELRQPTPKGIWEAVKPKIPVTASVHVEPVVNEEIRAKFGKKKSSTKAAFAIACAMALLFFLLAPLFPIRLVETKAKEKIIAVFLKANREEITPRDRRTVNPAPIRIVTTVATNVRPNPGEITIPTGGPGGAGTSVIRQEPVNLPMGGGSLTSSNVPSQRLPVGVPTTINPRFDPVKADHRVYIINNVAGNLIERIIGSIDNYLKSQYAIIQQQSWPKAKDYTTGDFIIEIKNDSLKIYKVDQHNIHQELKESTRSLKDLNEANSVNNWLASFFSGKK